MSSKRLVIGDVHGSYNALCSLLGQIGIDNNDQVYFLGDLIDRGPQSAKVVELVIDNKYKCILGNHELMLLQALGKKEINHLSFQEWQKYGGNATVMSYGHKMLPEEHLEWIKSLPFYFDLGDYWLVHAGIDPCKPIIHQSPKAFCWIRGRFHRSTKPYFKDKTIIVGHTITFTFPGVEPGKIVQGKGWLGIDTGAYRPLQGWLTALDLNNSIVYQVDSLGKRFRCLSLDEAIQTINPLELVRHRSQFAFSES
jgi:serine/threonine protein phosphatase 1